MTAERLSDPTGPALNVDLIRSFWASGGQNKLMTVITKIESMIEGHIERQIQALSPPTADEYLNSRQELWEKTSQFEFIIGAIERVHGNVATLLTHISAMIAALGIILVLFQGQFLTTLFIFFEMIIYTLLAICCVYCIKFQWDMPRKEDPKEDTQGDRFVIYFVYLRSRYIYNNLSRGVLINTVLFLFTIVIHALTLLL
jgi:hypothetical protein